MIKITTSTSKNKSISYQKFFRTNLSAHLFFSFLTIFAPAHDVSFLIVEVL